MKLKSLAAVAASVAIAAGVAYAFLGGLVVNGNFAASQKISIPLGGGVSGLGVVVTYSSPSFSQATFTSGQVSTGSITIADNTKLSTASATDSIVVNSTSGSQGDYVSMSFPIQPGAAVVSVSRDWRYGPTVSSAATSLAAALSRYSAPLGGVQFIASGNVVYATAPVSALYNGIHVFASNSTTLTAAHATFVGGRSSAIVYVNGSRFQANRDYAVGVSASASATNLAAAINARAGLNALVAATPSGSAVNIVGLVTGGTYALSTTNSAAASVSAATTYGAVAASWKLGGKTIALPAHGLPVGLAVLFSGSNTYKIDPLVDQTTYYAIPASADSISLATTPALALAGTALVWTSSQTLTASSTYKIAPLAFSAGSAGFALDVSNDGITWAPLANTSSFTYTSPGSSTWSFGALPYRFLGLDFTGPSAGAVRLQVNAQGQ